MKNFLQNAVPLVVLVAIQSVAQAGVIQDHQGHWLGDMKIPNGQVLKIGADLFARADGSFWASVAVPEQSAYDIPATKIREAGASIDIDIPMANLKLTWVTDHFNAEWKQGGPPLAFELKQVNEFPMKVRPQTPKAPFPYKDETLAIVSSDGVTLGATLSIPNGKAHPNVVVLVHGSGPSTRDENILGHQSFAVLADYLARQGVAVLRYDKRGIARSTGDYEQHTAAQLAEDLFAVTKALKTRKQFNRIGLVGHSEGPGIAAAVAAHHPESVDFLVSLAGVGLSGLDLMLLQDRAAAKDHGAKPEDVARIMVYVRKYYEIIIAQTDTELRMTALKALYAGLSPEDRLLVEKYRMNEGTLSMSWADKPFLRVVLTSNPQADWRAVKCPVLALNGSLDHQVPGEENLGGITLALKTGGNKNVETAILPSLNHLFQTAKTGSESEYGAIEETIAPIALQRVATFVTKQ